MRILSISFLFLAMGLPALAHHDRDHHEYRHSWGHREMMVEDCGPRYISERPLTPPWGQRPRVIFRESRPWCDRERDVVFVPPPSTVIVRPRVSVWFGF